MQCTQYFRQKEEINKHNPTHNKTGHHPAHFQLYKIMLNFLKYILDQEKYSLISVLFRAQRENHKKGDWVRHIKKFMVDMNFNFTFKNIVDRQVKKASLKYILSKIILK